MKPSHPAFSLPRTARSVALLAAACLGACSTAPTAPLPAPPLAGTTMTNLGGKLSGANEVPAVLSQGTGTVEAQFNPATLVLTWKVTYGGLSSPTTAAHFHGPALPGQNAGIAVPVTSGLASPIVGTVALTPAQATALAAGKWYFNVHTVAYPGGEIRGQVVVQTGTPPG